MPNAHCLSFPYIFSVVMNLKLLQGNTEKRFSSVSSYRVPYAAEHGGSNERNIGGVLFIYLFFIFWRIFFCKMLASVTACSLFCHFYVYEKNNKLQMTANTVFGGKKRDQQKSKIWNAIAAWMRSNLPCVRIYGFCYSSNQRTLSTI